MLGVGVGSVVIGLIMYASDVIIVGDYVCDIPCIDGVSRFIGGVSVVFWTTMGCGLMSVAMTFS